MKNIPFKPYNQHQRLLFPPNVGDLIDKNHPVRFVSDIIDKIDISPLLKQYKGGGTSAYHPRMMLKVIVYAYMRNIYSSREIERSIKENIHFMWLAGGNTPDHNTISRFRSERLKGAIEEIFKQIVMKFHELGVLDIEEIYVDGTKIRANANKYKFVWRKKVKKNKERIKERVKELLKYAESVAKEEISNMSEIDFDKIDGEELEEVVSEINKALKGKDIDKEKKKRLKYINKRGIKNYKKYEREERLLGGRNGYSKTDPDASPMKLKEDCRDSKLAKPGYNLQLSTNNQFIVNYSIHSNAGDSRTLIPHLEEYKAKYGKFPKVLVADAGYGSEENYAYLERQKIKGYVKYNHYDREQKKGVEAYPEFHQERFVYKEEGDYYVCPLGCKLIKDRVSKRVNKSGYIQEYHIYKGIDCGSCKVKDICCKGSDVRVLQINHKLRVYKNKVKELLRSKEGSSYVKRRSYEVERVFSELKWNKGFRRFLLRGKLKVKIEVGLLSISHNIFRFIMVLIRGNPKLSFS